MKEKFDISGMTCAACSANIERAVNKISGVNKAEVSLMTNTMNVDFDKDKTDIDEIIKAVSNIGYGANLQAQKSQVIPNQNISQEENLRKRFFLSLGFLIALMYVSMGHMIGLALPDFLTGTKGAISFAFLQFLLTLPVIFINRTFFISGFKGLKNFAPNMDSLVALGASASLIYGIYAIFKMSIGFGTSNLSLVDAYRENLYFESSAMILSLITLGKYFEEKSKNKTKNSIKSLMNLAPKMANVVIDGEIVSKKVEDIKLGDIILVKAGEKIPCDGIIVEGQTSINQAAVTGESIPLYKKVNDRVISATINGSSPFKFKATKVGQDTTISKIISMVSVANQSKAPISKLADKISGVFVPTVIFISIMTFIIWFLIDKNVEKALNFAISVLVISCPCALGLATPVSIMVATGMSAKQGLLFKNAEVLENLHKIDSIVLDKTGTITNGKAQVTEIFTSMDKNKFLDLIINLEKNSEHPLSKSIIDLKKDYPTKDLKVENFKSIAGRGIEAEISGKKYLAGNLPLMEEKNIDISKYEKQAKELQKSGKTLMYFSDEKEIIGLVALIDLPKKNSKKAIKNLKDLGYKIIMLTGDNIYTANAIKELLNIDKVYAELMPEDKIKIISKLQEEGKKILMVGDGINDAPALAKADIGMAIGGGTDVAIESSDVVLMSQDLLDISKAIEISQATIKNIKGNLFWAFFYNVCGIPLAAGILYNSLGLKLNPMFASVAMSFSSVFVVTNALRLYKFKSRIIDNNNNKKFQTQDNKSKLNSQEFKNINEKGEDSMEKLLEIEGMSCNHCVNHVKEALEGLDGVKEASVSLEKNQARVILDKEVSEKSLKDVVKKAGYELTSIK